MTNAALCHTPAQTEPINRLFSDFFAPGFRVARTPASTSAWVPPAEVVSESDAYRFRFDVPGIAREDLDISLEDSTLTVRGERRAMHKAEEANADTASQVVRTETVYGTFQRSFRLPKDADGGAVTATCKDGVLEVAVGKLEAVKPRKIEIS